MADELYIYSDGGARGNPGPAAIGVLICDGEGRFLKEHGETIGEATNNIAEYTAVIVALELAKDFPAKKVSYFSDSQLVVNQLMGKFKIKTPHIKTLYDQVKVREKVFGKVTYTHLRREHEKIQHVDALVNQALDGG